MELKYAPGSVRNNKRLGRGVGSGQGKTAGRGHKGQKARAGKKISPSFEGGQMRLIRRMPKRGFSNPARLVYQIVNVGDLTAWDKTIVIDCDSLKARQMIRTNSDPVKILGDGIIEQALTVRVNAISATARQKIETAGGTVEVLG